MPYYYLGKKQHTWEDGYGSSEIQFAAYFYSTTKLPTILEEEDVSKDNPYFRGVIEVRYTLWEITADTLGDTKEPQDLYQYTNKYYHASANQMNEMYQRQERAIATLSLPALAPPRRVPLLSEEDALKHTQALLQWVSDQSARKSHNAALQRCREQLKQQYEKECSEIELKQAEIRKNSLDQLRTIFSYPQIKNE